MFSLRFIGESPLVIVVKACDLTFRVHSVGQIPLRILRLSTISLSFSFYGIEGENTTRNIVTHNNEKLKKKKVRTEDEKEEKKIIYYFICVTVVNRFGPLCVLLVLQ